MTIPLEKTIRRRVKIGGVECVVELTKAGILFRPLGARGKKARVVTPWFDALARAEFLAGIQDRREQLRAAAIGRHAGHIGRRRA